MVARQSSECAVSSVFAMTESSPPCEGRFRAGDVVKGHFEQDVWYLATIERDNGDGTYTVAWLDGDPSNCRKLASELKLMRFDEALGRYAECTSGSHGEHASPVIGRKDGPSGACSFRHADVVKAHFRDGEYYLATIEHRNSDGTYTVAWLDGDVSERVKQPEEMTRMIFDLELQGFCEDPSEGLPQGTTRSGSAEVGTPPVEEVERIAAEPEDADACSEVGVVGAFAGKAPPGHDTAGKRMEEIPQLGRSCVSGHQEWQGEDDERRECLSDLPAQQHWVVQSNGGAQIHRKHDMDSPMLCTLLRGDIVIRDDPYVQRPLTLGSQEWLPLYPGAKVYREGLRVFGDLQLGGSFVTVRDGDVMHLRRSASAPKDDDLVQPRTPAGTSACMVLRLLAGFGEAWIVKHERVVVRSGPSTAEPLFGFMAKGDIVGVKRRVGNWVELAPDSDVRIRSGIQGLGKVRTMIARWSGRRYKLSAPSSLHPIDGREAGRLAATAPQPTPCMMVNHPTYGDLLRRCQELPAGLQDSCFISNERRAMYREVIGLVRTRIYEENLEALWEGEKDKLPSLETLEQKLFDNDVTVVHASGEDTCTGGAIVKEVHVRATADSDSFCEGEDDGPNGYTTVGYIDSFAAVPGTHAGSAIWSTVINMDFALVACHTILLESTVKFWKARGMQFFDPSKLDDHKLFRNAVHIGTVGRLLCELADLQKALPPSKLPLMVWVRPFHTSGFDPNQSYVFMPDEESEPEPF